MSGDSHTVAGFLEFIAKRDERLDISSASHYMDNDVELYCPCPLLGDLGRDC